VGRWIDKLLKNGVLELDEDADDDEYRVPGAQRSPSGPTSCEEYEAKRKLIDEAKARILAKRAGEPPPESDSSKDKDEEAEDDERESEDEEEDDGRGMASIVGRAALMASGKALVVLDKPLELLDRPSRGKGDKSLAASAALSLLGPIGWLYAGSFREAIPATAAAIAVYTLLPSFILAPFMLVGALASSAVGLTYAWQFNRKKGRTPLFLRGKSDKKNKKNSE
jgi:hypothetical protein